MQTEIMKVKGMTCMGCVNSVKNVLEKIPGVSSSEVSLEQGQVTIQYDADMTGTDQFRGAIEDAGFEVLNQAKGS
jgi:copper chaperone